jgi:Tfp pilus assembly protein PilZ
MSDRASNAGPQCEGIGEERSDDTVRAAPRRSTVRIPLRISTIDPKTDPGAHRPYFLTSEECSADVSRGGAFVLTDEALDPGSRLVIELELPSGPTIQRIARVVWNRISIPGIESIPNRRPGIGIEFIGGRADHVQEFERYLTRFGRPRPSALGVGAGRHPST